MAAIDHLKGKQKAFVREYVRSLNATKAAIAAGYSEKTAAQMGLENLRKPHIAAAIEELKRAEVEEIHVDTQRVLRGYAEVAFGDIRALFTEDGRLKRPHELTREQAALLDGIDVVTVSAGEGEVQHVAKIRTRDRLRALDQLAKYTGGFSDKVKVDASDELLEAARALCAGAQAVKPGTFSGEGGE